MSELLAEKKPARSEGAGFTSTTPKTTKRKKTPNVLYQHIFHGLIPGDVCRAVESSLREMGLTFEETSTTAKSMMGEEEVPFVRHQTEDEGVEIPFGNYRVEGIGDVTMKMHPYAEIPALMLLGALSSKDHKPVWQELLRKVKTAARRDSIFRGKALRVEEPNDLIVPKLMDLSKDVSLAFNTDIEEELETVLFWPLENRMMCQQNGIRTRRGVILEGHYGAGKSALLYKAARIARQAGWGVLHITSQMVGTAIELSKLLEPVVLIVEDIDASAHGDRDRLNFLLNRLSSVATKAKGDYALLLSTNFIDRIDPALLRPERVDAIVKIDLPDADTVGRLTDLFGGDMLVGEYPLAQKELAGTTPAIISEIVQRAKIDALRVGDKTLDEKRLLFHAKRMEKQRALATPVFRSATKGDKLAKSLQDVLNEG